MVLFLSTADVPKIVAESSLPKSEILDQMRFNPATENHVLFTNQESYCTTQRV